MGGGFYPHGKPGYYAYTRYFVDNYGGSTGHLAETNTQYPGLSGPKGNAVVEKALANLKVLIDSARAAELAFIRDTGIDINDPNNAGDVFRAMNLIFNSKQTFERGIRYMKELSGGGLKEKEQMYRDVTRYFGSYLEAAVREGMKNIRAAQLIKMTPDEVKIIINNIISEALRLSYIKVQDFIKEDGIRGKFGKAKSREGEEAIQAIADMIDVINKLKEMNAFSEFGHLFNLDKDTLYKWRKQEITFKQRKGNKYNNAEVDSNYGGNALELITTLAATELGKINIQNPNLTIVGHHTGQSNQMKADTLLFVGRGSVNPDEYIDYVDRDTFGNRVRMQNVDALDRYLEKLSKNIDHVIAISDKNYSIKAGFEGVNAQEKMNLQNAGLLLSQFGLSQIPELIRYLANCGPLMVQGNVDDAIRTELQTYIAYFLFDHLEFSLQGSTSKPNVVNLLNVSGLYIPLSVYLEGLYNSLMEAAANPSSFVSVTISLGGPTEQSHWTAATWGQFREEHETESFISYKILRGIADFIAGL